MRRHGEASDYICHGGLYFPSTGRYRSVLNCYYLQRQQMTLLNSSALGMRILKPESIYGQISPKLGFCINRRERTDQGGCTAKPRGMT